MKQPQMMKVTCISVRRHRPTGVTMQDTVVYDQYIWPHQIDAIIQPDVDDLLPNCECLVVYSGQTFNCTEPMEDLVKRVNAAVKELA